MTAEAIWRKLHKGFLKKDEDEEYVLEEGDTKAAYKICAELFGPKMLSDEIMVYIKEMIDAEKTEIREELAERLASFLDDLIEIKFFDADSHKGIKRLEGKKHIDISMNIFYAFWHILLELKKGVNYVNEKNKQEFLYLLHCLTSKKNKLNLSHQRLKNTYLSGVNLNRANLQLANLSRSNLSRSNLTGANLIGSNLHRAYLNRANFSSADCRKANFSRGIFDRADFSDADLSGVDFIKAYFYKTDFSNAYLCKATFHGAKNLTFSQLSKAKTLYDCEGLEPELEKRLRKECPHLFEYPF